MQRVAQVDLVHHYEYDSTYALLEILLVLQVCFANFG